MGHILALRMRRIPSLLQPITTVDPILLIHAISSSSLSPSYSRNPLIFSALPCVSSVIHTAFHPLTLSSSIRPPSWVQSIVLLSPCSRSLDSWDSWRTEQTAVRLPAGTDGLRRYQDVEWEDYCLLFVTPCGSVYGTAVSKTVIWLTTKNTVSFASFSPLRCDPNGSDALAAPCPFGIRVCHV